MWWWASTQLGSALATPAVSCCNTHVCLLWWPCVPAGEQLFDNNEGKDYTYATTAGGTWEEWQAAALERQAEQEKERHKAEEVGS